MSEQKAYCTSSAKNLKAVLDKGKEMNFHSTTASVSAVRKGLKGPYGGSEEYRGNICEISDN